VLRLMAEFSLLIFPGPDLGTGRIWHRSAAEVSDRDAERGGLPGLQRAVSLSPSG
jgi:hypothetical protein